jgi:hypothetical protein
MGLMESLALFNVIKLLSIVMPEGLACVFVLAIWLGFFAEMCFIIAILGLTKEQTTINARARISMEDIAVLVYPSGSTREIILPRRAKAYTEKMEGGDCTWVITPEGFMSKSNGVRFTYLHPELPHNVSLNDLVKFYTGTELTIDHDDNTKETLLVRNLIRNAQQQDRDIYEIAMASVEDLMNPGQKITNAAIAIALILAVCGGLAIIFIMLPKPAGDAVAQTAATTVSTITTTTLQGLSTIKPT